MGGTECFSGASGCTGIAVLISLVAGADGDDDCVDVAVAGLLF